MVLDKRQATPIMLRMGKRTDTRPSVSKQLLRIIEDSGISRYEVARLTGVQQSALSRFVRGERGLSLAAVDQLGKLFDFELVAHGPKG